MRKTIKNSIAETVQNIIHAGLTTSFTDKELKTLGVDIPKVDVTTEDIKK